MTTSSQLRTLGAFELTIDGRPIGRPSTQKARALTVYLAMKRGTAVSREEIVEAFWPDADPENARSSLKTALWSIRRALRDAKIDPAGVISADNSTICWHALTTVDCLEFGARAIAGDRCALDVYAGEFLPGDYDTWASSERERLIRLLETLLGALLAESRSIADAQRLLSLDPYSEAAYAALIEAELQSGSPVAAQALYARFESVLRAAGLHASPDFERRFDSLRAAERARVTPFFGRAEEITAFESLLEDPAGASVVVHADAGFGKTALLEQFARCAARSRRNVVTMAFHENEREFGGWDTFYAQVSDLRGPGAFAARGENAALALAQAVAAVLPPGSCLLLDDVQYASGDALFITREIVVRARERGAICAFAVRPEGLRSAIALAAGGRVREMRLAGLRREDVAAAISPLTPNAAERVRLLYERTRGHPLFLRSLLERGAAVDSGFEMPESVRALIEERLRARGSDAHTVAAVLALDRLFKSEEMASVLGWDEARVLDALDDLLGLGLVVESNDSTHVEFAHEVVMEVARDSLRAQRRRRLHRMSAQVLDGARDLRGLNRAAAHWSAAGEAARAAPLYLRCAQAARREHQNRNALDFAELARAQCAQLETGAEVDSLLLQIDASTIEALNAVGDCPAAERVATRAMNAAFAAGDARAALRMRLLRMSARMGASDLAGVAEDAREAAKAGEALGDDLALAEAYHGMAVSALGNSSQPEAVEFSARALDRAVAGGDMELAVFLAGWRIHALGVFWRFGEAIQTLERGEELLHSSYVATEANFRHNVAQLMYLLERYDEAKANIAKAMHVLRAPDLRKGKYCRDPQRTAAILTNMQGLIAVALGEWEQAVAAAEAFDSDPAMQIRAAKPHAVDLLVRALLGRNEPGDALRAHQKLATLDDAPLADDVRAYVPCARARVAARLQETRARELLDEALSAAHVAAKRVPLEADALFASLAIAASECGAKEQERLARESASRYRAMRRSAAESHWGGLEAEEARMTCKR